MFHMFRASAFATFCILGVLSTTAALAQEASGSLREAVDAAVARVKPALVRIHVVQTDYEEGREVKYESSGSGAIITKEGHIITNHHVAGHATRLFCTLSTKEEIEADIVGVDPLTDIAVIKLKAEAAREFPVAPFGDSAVVRVGDNVLAMGSPMALSQSVTLGIVSNVEMIMPQWIRDWGGIEQDEEDVGSLVKWIGHDAFIAGGNSGGPLVNLSGEIIGINEISMALGGAIPGNLARAVSDQLVAKGFISRAWLGLSVQPRLKHGKEERGVLVSGVIGDSPSDAAGVKAGDVLVRIGEQDVDVRFDEQIPDFNRLIADLPVGQETGLVVLRDGQETALRVTPGLREKAKPKEHELKLWGITASDISLIQAKEMKRANQDGVLVTSVRPGGPAGEAKPQIAQKSVIVEVSGRPVKSLRDLVQMTDEITKDKKDPVSVLTAFDRGTERFLTVVDVGKEDLKDPGLEVKKAWLPVETQVLTRDIAQTLGKPDLTGFCVTSVYPESTAEKAGLKTGDFVLAVDEERLTASAPEDYEELSALIRNYGVGVVVQLKVLRGQEELLLPVELVRAPMLDREMKEYRDDDFEFTVRDISFFDKARQKLKQEQTGVMVTEIKPGGWAALGELKVEDIILSLAGTDIGDVAGFETKMKELAAAKPGTIVIKVMRGIYTLYLELEPKWDNGD